MSNKKQQFVDDIEFVFSEVLRIEAEVLAGNAASVKDDFFFDIPHHKLSWGKRACGRAASARLDGLAEEAMRRAGLVGKVSVQTLRKALDQLIVDRFIKEQRPLDIQQIERVLSAAGKAARASCTDITHLIPCHLMLAKDPDEIPLGPVVFLNRRAARRLLLQKVKAWRRGAEKRDAKLLAGALRYYRSFNWIAEVRIEGCDEAISKDVAERAVVSALDCIHLVLGAIWTDRMQVGGPKLGRDPRAALRVNRSGGLDVALSWSGPGQVNFPDGWSTQLDEIQLKRPFELCGVALEAAVAPGLERPLSRRFLDAAQWFGEAARDPSPSTRVVKYVTALERMVMTDEKDDITGLVAERVAALCFNPANPVERQEWREKTRRAYALRSKLVHGAMSPRSTEVFEGVRLGAELGQVTLLSALNHIAEHGLRTEKYSTKQLAHSFRRLITWADQFTAPSPAQGE